MTHKLDAEFLLANLLMKPYYCIIVIFFLCNIGCNRCQISHVQLNDPDAGLTGKINVKYDGTFNDQVKSGSIVGALAGRIHSIEDQRFQVSVEYERKTYTSETTLQSNSLSCQLTAGAGVDLLIGKRPIGDETQEPSSENPLENFSIQLIRRE